MFAKSAPIGLVALSVAGPVCGHTGEADRPCPQALAVYGLADSGFVLEFTGDTERFLMVLDAHAIAFDGFIYPGEDGGREAVLLDQCPEGDVTGAELAACTVWRGRIAAVAEDGGVHSLPPADQPAAPRLKLEGFDAALAGSRPALRSALPAGALDEWTRTGCRQQASG